MGLAQRFKQQIEKENIFQKGLKKFVSRPDSKLDFSCDESKKFENLESAIIDKIRKTPYWNDYTSESKEKMISKYFDTKVKRSNYSEINYNLGDKNNFIKNILDLAG